MSDMKNDIQDIRTKQAEIEELLEVYNKKTQESYFLKETFAKEQEKLKNLKEEYLYRKELSNKISSEIDNLTYINGHDAIKNINEIRKKTIKQILNNDLCLRVSQLNRLNKSLPSDSKDNAFYQLVFDSVKFRYRKREHSFKIMKSTTFLDIKAHLCEIYKVEDIKEFVITDNIEALITNEYQCIDDYLRQYSVFNNIFNFIQKDEFKKRSKITLIQEDRLKENITGKNRQYNIATQRIHEVNTDYDIVEKKMNAFNMNYPLHYIFNKVEDKTKLKPVVSISEKAKNIETSFAMFVFLILNYIFTLVSIYGDTDIGRNLIFRNYFNNVFNNTYVNDPVSLFNYLSNIGLLLLDENFTQRAAMETNVPPDYKKILQFYLGNNYNTSDPLAFTQYINNTKLNSLSDYQLFSDINFIIYKTNTKPCDLSLFTDPTFANTIQVNKCYYPTFSSSNKVSSISSTHSFLVSDFNNFISNNRTFPELNTGFTTPFAGDLNTDGRRAAIKPSNDALLYLFDLINMIPVNPNFHSYSPNSTFSLPNNDINNYFMVDLSTRAIQIVFTLYNINFDKYYTCNINFFLTATGRIFPGNVIVEDSIFAIYSKSGSTLAADVIRMICIIILFVLSIYNLVKVVMKFNPEKPLFENFKDIKSKLSILTFVLLICYLVVFFFRITYLQPNIYDSTTNTLTQDASFYIYNWGYSKCLECVFIIFLSMKLLSFLTLNDFIKVFFKSIEKYTMSSLYYLLFFVIIVLIFSSINYILFGLYVSESKTYTLAYLNVLMFTIGGMPLQSWIYVDYFWSVFFVIIYYSFLILFTSIVFISIYADSLRRTINRNGYPTDNITDNWTTYDYLRWLFFCLKIDETRINQNK